jgi:hypothetical protein
MNFKLLILFILKILEDLNKWWREYSGVKFTILYVKKWESRGTGNDVRIYVRSPRDSDSHVIPTFSIINARTSKLRIMDHNARIEVVLGRAYGGVSVTFRTFAFPHCQNPK